MAPSLFSASPPPVRISSFPENLGQSITVKKKTFRHTSFGVSYSEPDHFFILHWPFFPHLFGHLFMLMMVTIELICGVLDILIIQVSLDQKNHLLPRQISTDCPAHSFLPTNLVELQGWNVVISSDDSGNFSTRFGQTIDRIHCLEKCVLSTQRPRCRFVSYDLDRGVCSGFTAAAVVEGAMSLERSISGTLLGQSGKKFDRKERFRLQNGGHLLGSRDGLKIYSAESCLALCNILPQCNVCTFNEYSGLCWLKSLASPVALVEMESASKGAVSFLSWSCHISPSHRAYPVNPGKTWTFCLKSQSGPWHQRLFPST